MNTTGTPSTPAERRASALRRAAQAKRQAAIARAETAIRQLVKNKQEINFRSVARAGGVSIDFLYASADLRHRIESLRTQQAAHGPSRTARPETSDPGESIIQVLTTKLREERAAGTPSCRTSSNGSPPPTGNSSGSAASCNSTDSKPDCDVADASATSPPAITTN